MSGTTVKKAVHTRFEQLSTGERKVARALLSDYPASGLGTASELAEAAGVSPPTVVRFASRLGYEGLPPLQRALRSELGNEYGSPLRQYEDKARSGDDRDLPGIAESLIAAVSDTHRELPVAEVERAVEILASPRRHCMAIGGRFTHVAAAYLCAHLAMIRPRVHELRLGDIESRGNLLDAGRETVLVVIDVRRYDPRLERAARAAKDRDATVCLITDHWLSPLSKTADIVLPVAVETASPFDSILGVFSVVEALIAATSHGVGASVADRLAAFEDLNPDAQSAPGDPHG